eukprot:CAMPEP_0196141580 /NCGR_PEP_ID=MMETSP0910-20130528/9962_1 /TAXON_ID=49265 /ORGANISM="Thalassiosira rotula, Strain GSO102" /LENGTH=463 /DNA_ID=CAMNT_0041402747 /DNA_START=18 /DNA_END=1409 /DNA_ORIENTATION=-
MKFCRNLQRVIDITDPEWAPYWTNYKMLKKFLKALVPPEDAVESSPPSAGDGDGGGNVESFPQQRSRTSSSELSDRSCAAGDVDVDGGPVVGCPNGGPDDSSADEKEVSSSIPKIANPTTTTTTAPLSSAAQMSRNPGEVAFFKLLNSELKKAIHFFDQAQLEIEIREARVREGIDIMRKANSLMVNEKWTLMAKSLYRLYKDLLLLETYAIMTYCSFSKILKKHDKVTKHTTRIAFMKNVVSRANFTHYPKLLAMISRCERLYDEVSQSLEAEGKSGLYEDERLFINMIHQLNEQALGTAEVEGAPNNMGGRNKEQRRHSVSGDRLPSNNGTGNDHSATTTGGGEHSFTASSRSSIPSQSQVNTLRSLVGENAMNKSSKDGLDLVAESDQVVFSSAATATTKDDVKLPPQSREDTREHNLADPTTTAAAPEDVVGGKRPLFPPIDSKAEVLQPSVKRPRSES